MREVIGRIVVKNIQGMRHTSITRQGKQYHYQGRYFIDTAD